MRPKPFRPQPLENPSFVRDATGGLVWFRCEMRTLYIDTDRSQVVYHSNYLKYFEFARASLMRETKYPYKQIEEDGFVYPIIKTELNYYSPLYYDDLMTSGPESRMTLMAPMPGAVDNAMIFDVSVSIWLNPLFNQQPAASMYQLSYPFRCGDR